MHLDIDPCTAPPAHATREYNGMGIDYPARLARSDKQKAGNMNAYKIKYEDGTFEVVIAKNSLEVVKKYDLATREHINTRIIELEGEQKAIAIANWNEQF